ncbi:MAG: tRNA (adenosine(37)-N6)-threonylcarbamoyltransferase complex ATPase subunit type 1 TsaE [Oceanospirillaceae bacterium]|nr:tRNA (adenosine(37)-N6)-threonylcarbamoyltransferase complex ATPase subunit type 1 TsaE [Oceanospirillaceae bacterium]
MQYQRVLADEAAMVAFGAELAQVSEGQGVIFLEGDLGMGKTTLCRGVLQGFGHTGAVKSPTYTLVEPYELKDKHVYHFDLYRLSDPEELEYLGIRDYFDNQALCLIEWPDKGAGILPQPDLILSITVEGRGRRIQWQPGTQFGQQLADKLLEQR